jgi:HlyD family type I secretion membrane fusion protein
MASLGGRGNAVYIAPRPVISTTLPVRRAFSGPTAFLPSAPVEDGDRRASLINARTPVLVGVIIILVAFVGIGGWAAIAPIDSAAIASGTVAIESGRQTIQHLEGGIIKQILVQDGDHVKAGQVLVRMDDTRAQAELSLIQGELDLADATYARLGSERDGLSAPKYPARLLSRASDPEVAELLAGQSNLFKARSAVVNGQKDILRQQIGQYQQEIKGYQAIEQSKQVQLSLVKTELSDLSGLLQQGYVTKSRVLALQRQEGQLEGERGQAIAEMARAQQGIGESNRQILQIDNQRQEDVSKDLHSLEGELNDLRQKLIAAQDVVKRLDILAPIDGTVTNLSIHTVGGVIGPGASLMEIVPANDTLIVEAEVSPIDINTVHVGQEVSVRVVAAGARLLPVIYGRLDEISADRMVVPGTATSPGRIFYEARISIPPEQAARLGDIKLKVGMPVEAMITRGSQTALHYALKPLIDSLSRSFREQ